jgi:cytoskeleton protein RodZ
MNSPSASNVTKTTAAAAPAPVSSSPPPVRDSGGQIGPGRLITAAREKAGLSVESLAGQIRLSRGTLDALERDDFGTLNEPVYVKGYYRKCAKVLGLVDTDLIAAYERVVGPKQPQPPTKLLLAADRGLSRRSGVAGAGGSLRWLWVVIVAALIGGVAYLLTTNPSTLSLSKSQTSGDTYSQTGLATVPATTATSPTRPASPSQVVAQSAPATELPPQAAAPTPAAPAHASAAPTTTPSPAAVPANLPPSVSLSPSTALSSASSTSPAAADELALSFRGTSWVRVEDSNGKVLLSGVIQAGDRQAIHGKPPYSVFLGNAPGVILEFNGRPFDATPYVKQNSTARFSVPQ